MRYNLILEKPAAPSILLTLCIRTRYIFINTFIPGPSIFWSYVFYRTSYLQDRGATAIKSIQEFGSRLTQISSPFILLIFSQVTWIKECEIWFQFSTAVAIQSPSFWKVVNRSEIWNKPGESHDCLCPPQIGTIRSTHLWNREKGPWKAAGKIVKLSVTQSKIAWLCSMLLLYGSKKDRIVKSTFCRIQHGGRRAKLDSRGLSYNDWLNRYSLTIIRLFNVLRKNNPLKITPPPTKNGYFTSENFHPGNSFQIISAVKINHLKFPLNVSWASEPMGSSLQ